MKKHPFPIFMAIAYSALLVRVMVFKDIPTITLGSVMLNFAGTDGGHPANFVPFTTIVPYLLGNKGPIIAGINLLGNIAPLVPIGLLAPFVFRNITRKKCLILAIAAGLSIELLQTILHVGIFDIDDVILNALGVMTGYGMCRLLIQWVRAKNYKNIVISAAVTLTVAAAVYGVVILPMTHRTVHYKEGVAAQTGDPCNGTSGTGRIIQKGTSAITIKSRSGVVQTIQLSARTVIRTAAGPAASSDLKVGDDVTIVIYDGKAASTVLVCGV